MGDAVGGVPGLDAGARALTQRCAALALLRGTLPQCHLLSDHSFAETRRREKGTLLSFLLPSHRLREP